MPDSVEQQRGKIKYLNQVRMWNADEDLAVSQPFISTARLKFKHDAQILPRQLYTHGQSEGYSLMAPERVPMASSCRDGL